MGSSLSSTSTSTNSPITSTTPTPTKEKCKACCACPETKRARDQCIVENGEADCTKLIEAHKQCMRDAGFVIN